MIRRRRRFIGLLVALACGLAIGRWWFGPVAKTPTPAAALDRVVPTIRFSNVPLERALAAFQQGAGVPIDVDLGALSQCGINRDDPVTLHRYDTKLSLGLELVRRQLPPKTVLDAFVVSFDDRRIIIGPPQMNPRRSLKSYEVGDLIQEVIVPRPQIWDAPEPPWPTTEAQRRDELERLPTETVEPDSWIVNGGSMGVSSLLGTKLIVFTTENNHETLAKVLHAVREQAKPGDSLSDWPGPNRQDTAMNALLERRSAGDLHIERKTFSQALDVIRESFRANLSVDLLWLQNAGYNDSEPFTLDLSRPTLSEALSRLLSPRMKDDRIAFRPDPDGGVVVTSERGAAEERAELVYDLRALMPPGTNPDMPDSSRDRPTYRWTNAIEEAVATDTWRNQGGNRATHFDKGHGRVLILQTRENHEKIRAFLDRQRLTLRQEDAR